MKLLDRFFKNKPVTPHVQVVFEVGGRWGDRIELDWERRRITGWKTPRPSSGDLLLVSMESGKTGILEIRNVKYVPDPPDMFFADVQDAGYLEDRPQVEQDLIRERLGKCTIEGEVNSRRFLEKREDERSWPAGSNFRLLR